MPPMLSDAESEDSGPDTIPAVKGWKAKTPDVDNRANADKSDADEDSQSEEEEDDEYQVEKIEGHEFLKGTLHYHIKWLGYDDENDMTWEPVDNLEHAREVLKNYHAAIGGTPEPPTKGSAKKGKRGISAGSKRTAQEASIDSPAVKGSEKKRGRKKEINGAPDQWEPPVGSWEDHVTHVAAIMQSQATDTSRKRPKNVQGLEALLHWNDGHKTYHPIAVIHQKCPQRLIAYYEQHLVFKGEPGWDGQTEIDGDRLAKDEAADL